MTSDIVNNEKGYNLCHTRLFLGVTHVILKAVEEEDAHQIEPEVEGIAIPTGWIVSRQLLKIRKS